MSVASTRMPGGYHDPLEDRYNVAGGTNTGNEQAWSRMLNTLADSGYDVEAIYQMLLGYLRDDGAETSERNDMFYQFLLGEASKQNQRNYDKSVRDEQRLYDLPTNLLNRLMATGMSRDAAFKLLSGSGSGAASLIGSGGSGTNASVSAPSGSMDLAKIQTGIQGAVSIADTMCNMVNTGMSAYVAYEQANLLNAQATMSQNQLEAYKLTGDAYNLIQEGVRRGIIDDQDGHVYDSVGAAQAALEELAKAGNTTAQDWHGNGTIRRLGELAPYSSEYLSNLYRSERSGRDYATQFSDQHRREENLNKLNQIQYADIAQGIEESKARISQIVSNNEFQAECKKLVIAQIDNEIKMGKKIDAETKNILVNSRLQRANAVFQEMQNDMGSWIYDQTEVQTSVGVGKVSGLSLFKQENLEKHKSAAWTANKLNNLGYWSKSADAELANVDMLISTNLLRHWYNEQTTSVINNMTPGQQALLGLCSAYSSGGVYDYMDRLLNANSTKTPLGTFIPKSVKDFVTDPVSPQLNVGWQEKLFGF